MGNRRDIEIQQLVNQTGNPSSFSVNKGLPLGKCTLGTIENTVDEAVTLSLRHGGARVRIADMDAGTVQYFSAGPATKKISIEHR